MLTPHILVVDDDAPLRRLLSRYLKKNNLLVSAADSAAQARQVLSWFAVDLIVLDVMMPQEDGWSMLAWLRKNDQTVPVIMLTALGESEDRIKGLSLGADDYVPKPYEPQELLLRIQAIMKRSQGEAAAADSLYLGSYRLLTTTGQLFDAQGQHIALTSLEQALLKVLAEQAGTAVSRETLLKQGMMGEEDRSERSIDVAINRLRRKFEEDPKQPRFLQTIRNKGYCLYAETHAS